MKTCSICSEPLEGDKRDQIDHTARCEVDNMTKMAAEAGFKLVNWRLSSRTAQLRSLGVSFMYGPVSTKRGKRGGGPLQVTHGLYAEEWVIDFNSAVRECDDTIASGLFERAVTDPEFRRAVLTVKELATTKDAESVGLTSVDAVSALAGYERCDCPYHPMISAEGQPCCDNVSQVPMCDVHVEGNAFIGRRRDERPDGYHARERGWKTKPAGAK